MDESIDAWPRRLLHVPSMTSYTWQPGNRYGSHVSPMYNAISYTWGRWRDRENSEPNVVPLEVKGIDWDMPRVLSKHFTTSEFQSVIKRAGNEHYIPSDGGRGRFNDDYPPPLEAAAPETVEFLWLDVACIDQRRDSPEMAIEVGRQAKIFTKARRTYVWLNSTGYDTLSRSLETIQKLASRMRVRDSVQPVDEDAPSDWVAQAKQALASLLADHWFSSLWTLQEAFLCHDSPLLSKDARGVHFNNDPTMTLFDLRDLTITCELFANAVTRTPELRAQDKVEQLSYVIQQKGISALAMSSAVILLACAWNRTTSRSEDRVYAIMQVFDLKLGKAAPGADPSKRYSLDELQLQFGKALLERHGFLSQFHIHSNIEPNMERWRPGRYSVLPEICRKVTMFWTNMHSEELATFSMKLIDSGESRGYFTGKMIPYKLLHTSLLRLDSSLRRMSAKRPKYRQLLALDRGDIVDRLPEDMRLINLPSSLMQDRLADEVAAIAAGLHVLLMATTEKSSKKSWMVGLLMEPPKGAEHHSTPCWTRTGIILWPLTYLVHELPASLENDIQRGVSEDWKGCSGYFN